MGEALVRIQDDEGRGPWRPGFSNKWVEDRDDHKNLVPWYVEFGKVPLDKLLYGHVGTGCRTVEQLRRWFTRTEYNRLLRLGYRAVRIHCDRVLAESDKQVLFARIKPLREDVETFDLYTDPPGGEDETSD